MPKHLDTKLRRDTVSFPFAITMEYSLPSLRNLYAEIHNTIFGEDRNQKLGYLEAIIGAESANLLITTLTTNISLKLDGIEKIIPILRELIENIRLHSSSKFCCCMFREAKISPFGISETLAFDLEQSKSKLEKFLEIGYHFEALKTRAQSYHQDMIPDDSNDHRGSAP